MCTLYLTWLEPVSSSQSSSQSWAASLSCRAKTCISSAEYSGVRSPLPTGGSDSNTYQMKEEHIHDW